jgi:hypothetical protein
VKLEAGQVDKVLRRGGDLRISQIGLNMMLSQLRYSYQLAPNRASLEQCTRELNAYLTRYSGIMGEDVRQLAAL